MKNGLVHMSLLALLLFSACKRNEEQPESPETPSSGKLVVACDESFRPLIDEEVRSFEAAYPDADIQVHYKPEPDVLNEFLQNHIRVAIISRKLTEEEFGYYQQQQIDLKQYKIATDAVVFVVHPDNPDSVMSYDQILGVLEGKLTSWNKLNAASRNDSIVVVFDHGKSSTVRYLDEEVLHGKSLAKNAFAVDSEAAVIDYVTSNPSALGVIGLSWISVKDDSIANEFLSKVRVVAIIPADSTGDKASYLPYRYNLIQGKYPFLRNLFLLNQEAGVGLGTGFASYVLSERGQLIIHHFGLLAARKPIRIIELQNDF